jgi:hypothetical protein
MLALFVFCTLKELSISPAFKGLLSLSNKKERYLCGGFVNFDF